MGEPRNTGSDRVAFFNASLSFSALSRACDSSSVKCCTSIFSCASWLSRLCGKQQRYTRFVCFSDACVNGMVTNANLNGHPVAVGLLLSQRLLQVRARRLQTLLQTRQRHVLLLL